MFASVLVPLDGSRFAEAALPAALHIVRRSNGVLHLVRVHQSPDPMTELPAIAEPKWTESVRTEDAAYLAGVVQRVAASVEGRCVTRLLDGLPVDAIAEYARSEEIELVVMASHGRGGVSRLWLGSVADGLVRHSPSPILLIRPPEGETTHVVAPTVSNLLVPMDGSDLSLRILPVVVSFARALDARVTLLRVVPTMSGTGVFGLVPLSELAAEATARADAELADLAKRMRAQGVAATHFVVQSAAVAATILEYTQGAGANAIAIATHGRGALGRAALGSVADKVVRGADVPVLVFRPESVRADSAHAAA